MHGQRWADIARHVEGRTDQQCMGRWRRHLDPAIKRAAWTPAEDRRLAELRAMHGRGLHSFTSQLFSAQLERFVWDRGCA